MKLLHTSDWHLGRTLYGRSRYLEAQSFLDWLLSCLEREKIDILLIAGDVFDTTTPSNRAQELYYRFLARVSATGCRHVVVIGGNHDSPTFLDAPGELLRSLGVHVVGRAGESPEEEVLLLSGPARDSGQGTSYHLILCAVPYLRDRDIRQVIPGESVEDKGERLIEGIRDHYRMVAEEAERMRAEMVREMVDTCVPIVGMGHLFTAGGKSLDGDGVRELYVGSLAHVAPSLFPEAFDYMALGHLHIPQRVAGLSTVRYSGSPFGMGFGEAGQEKSAVVVEFTREDSGKIGVDTRLVDIPCFQRLEKCTGSLDELVDRLTELKALEESIWLEIEHTGQNPVSGLRERLEEVVADSRLEILRIRDRSKMFSLLARQGDEELDDLDEYEVFQRCLDSHEKQGDERRDLEECYREIVTTVLERDRNRQ